MAHVVAMVMDGLALFVRTLWGLQERRFSTTFETVRSVAVSMTMSLMFCFLSIHTHQRGGIGLAFV